MIKIYGALLIWCIINFPFTLLFHKYHTSSLGSLLFFLGVFIILLVGLIKAHFYDKENKYE
jgi:hypothetical protein